MSRERRRQISAEGGRRAHALGKAHRWTSVEASAMGKKGGKPSHGRKKNERISESLQDEGTNGENGG